LGDEVMWVIQPVVLALVEVFLEYNPMKDTQMIFWWGFVELSKLLVIQQ
jgi:hypothetical protein